MAGEGGWGQQEQGSFFHSPLIDVNSSFDPNQRSVISHLHITKATVFAYCKRDRTCICMLSLVSQLFFLPWSSPLSVFSADTISTPLTWVQSQKVAKGQTADRDKRKALAKWHVTWPWLLNGDNKGEGKLMGQIRVRGHHSCPHLLGSLLTTSSMRTRNTKILKLF